MKELEGMRVKATREAIGSIDSIPSIKLDTPEDLEKTAHVLHTRARN
jgi:CMP-2-keto-3-deoxyoctulosonic acid synthetase